MRRQTVFIAVRDGIINTCRAYVAVIENYSTSSSVNPRLLRISAYNHFDGLKHMTQLPMIFSQNHWILVYL